MEGGLLGQEKNRKEEIDPQGCIDNQIDAHQRSDINNKAQDNL